MNSYNVYCRTTYGLAPFVKPLIVRYAPYVLVYPQSSYGFFRELIYEKYIELIDRLIEERLRRMNELRERKNKKHIVALDEDTYLVLKAYADEMQIDLNKAIRKAVQDGITATEDVVILRQRLDELVLEYAMKELELHSKAVEELSKLKSMIKRNLEIIRYNNRVEKVKAILSAIYRYMDLYGASLHELEARFGDQIDWLQREFGFSIFEFVEVWKNDGDPIKYAEGVVKNAGKR